MRAQTVEVIRLSCRKYRISTAYRRGRKGKRAPRLVRFADNMDNDRATNGGEVDGESLED
jgi:hypothetical protein